MRRSSPFNPYQDYELERNKNIYEYEKRQYEREEAYWRDLRRKVDEELYGEDDW